MAPIFVGQVFNLPKLKGRLKTCPTSRRFHSDQSIAWKPTQPKALDPFWLTR